MLAACRALGLPEPELNVRGLPATPDLLWRRERVAVLVHGCFWHGCPCRSSARLGRIWRSKIARNRERDARDERRLRRRGWRVVVVWEHEDPGLGALRVVALLEGESPVGVFDVGFEWSQSKTPLRSPAQTEAVKSMLRKVVDQGSLTWAANMCVGSGKTLIGALAPFILASAGRRISRVLIVTPGLSIRDQWEKKTFDPKSDKSLTAMFGLPSLTRVVLETESVRFAVRGDVVVVIANIQSLVRNIESFGVDHFDLIVVDETHHGAAESYVKVLNRFPRAIKILLTGTPYRSDRLRLPGFEVEVVDGETVMKPDYNYDLSSGWRDKIIKDIDLHELEYDRNQVVFNGESRVWTYDELKDENEAGEIRRQIIPSEGYSLPVLERMKATLDAKRAGGVPHRALVACMSVPHADQVHSLCGRLGLRSKVIHVNVNAAAIREIKDSYENGGLDVIINVAMLREGWDDPYCSVIVLLGIYASRGPVEQTVGRGLRSVPAAKRRACTDHVCDVIYPGATPMLKSLMQSLKSDNDEARRIREQSGNTVREGSAGEGFAIPPIDADHVEFMQTEETRVGIDGTMPEGIVGEVEPEVHVSAQRLIASNGLDLPPRVLTEWFREQSDRTAGRERRTVTLPSPRASVETRPDLLHEQRKDELTERVAKIAQFVRGLAGSDAGRVRLKAILTETGSLALPLAGDPSRIGDSHQMTRSYIKWRVGKKPAEYDDVDFEKAKRVTDELTRKLAERESA